MKKYIFQIVITEGNDEFWEEIGNNPGCDDVLNLVRRMLGEYGFRDGIDGCEIKLVKFEDK